MVEVDEGAAFAGDLDWTGLIMSSSSSRSASSGFWVVACGTYRSRFRSKNCSAFEQSTSSTRSQTRVS